MNSVLHLTLIALLIADLMALCMTSSDPLTSLCDTVCWEEGAIADQCVEDRCSKKRHRLRAFRKCEDRCWEVVVPCRRLCHDHSITVLDRCYTKCAPHQTDPQAEDCRWDCFTHNMMIIKARTLPRDYIGYKPEPR